MDLQKEIIEQYIQAYNQFDIEAMLAHLHHDIVFENFSEGIQNLRTEGIDEFKLQAEETKKYFKDRKQSITQWDIQIDRIVVEIDFEGILAVDLPNDMNAGDRLDLHGQSEFVFTDGKISKIVDRS